MTMYAVASSSAVPNTRTRFEWRTWAAAWASWIMRARSSSEAMRGLSSLMATSTPSSSSVARYTSAMPPPPMCAWIV
jgi:hypothetical protein